MTDEPILRPEAASLDHQCGVVVQSYLRSGRSIVPMRELERPDVGRDDAVGAISMVLEGVEVLGVDLWDEIDWLWPFVVQALDACRRTGAGAVWWPDQPILFTAKALWGDRLHLCVTDGGMIRRVAVAPAGEVYQAVARAGLEFLTEMERLRPQIVPEAAMEKVLRSWLV